ncbi:MAG: carboxypeptidase-like regulatory domain-containing protein [Muribaculaceae bacterium]|nr:carboxypeptidase-like regulatory domain-containing protein [Muribaculaceae bacterium]
MKISYKIILIFLLYLVLPNYLISADNVVEISGTIKNAKNKKVLGNVSVSIPGTNIGTVTNTEGNFTLKIPAKDFTKGLKAEQIGFQTQFVTLDENSLPLSIFLEPSGKVLKELLVLGGDPKEIVKMALRKIPDNYSDHDNLFSGFYRETIQKGNRFINISEAMVDVLKKPYKYRDIHGEKVSIHKGRSIVSPKSSDTLAVKLMGGPYMPIMLDAVKNGDHLFTIEEIDNYDFKMETGVMIDNQMHYAISFQPKVSLSYPLNSGVFYIDGDNLTISRVEFELDMKDKNKVTRSILQKKPTGLNFKPLEVSGMVTYKTIDGKSYINYISSKMRFKCDWKKRLFSSTYTSNAEMVMVDRDDSPDKHIKFNETFGKRKIFSDHVENYWDEDFWKDYNIIEPTESLEKAVDKLKK